MIESEISEITPEITKEIEALIPTKEIEAEEKRTCKQTWQYDGHDTIPALLNCVDCGIEIKGKEIPVCFRFISKKSRWICPNCFVLAGAPRIANPNATFQGLLSDSDLEDMLSNFEQKDVEEEEEEQEEENI